MLSVCEVTLAVAPHTDMQVCERGGKSGGVFYVFIPGDSADLLQLNSIKQLNMCFTYVNGNTGFLCISEYTFVQLLRLKDTNLTFFFDSQTATQMYHPPVPLRGLSPSRTVPQG